MAETALEVMERTEKPQKTRHSGFTPGVVYGEGLDQAVSVKFDLAKFEKMLKNHLQNAKLHVKLGDTNKFCVVKEIQRDHVNGRILHVDFQAVSENEIVRLKTPINYEGVSLLESKRLILLQNVSEIELEGRLCVIPESIIVDVGHREAGDKLTIKDLKLDAGIKAHIDEDKVLAVISVMKENVIPEEPAAAAAETPATEKAE